MVLGGKALRSHGVALRQEAREAVRGLTPDGYEQRRIRVLIDGLSRDVAAFADRIADLEATTAGQREDVRRLEDQGQRDRADLASERSLLARSDTEFVIRGTRYHRGQVEASAQARLARMHRDQATVEAKKRAIDELDAAVRDGRARLLEAQAARDGKVAELEVLSAELANATLRRDLQVLASSGRVTGSLARAESELAESMKAYADRVRSARRQVEAAGSAVSSPVLIPHGEAPEGGGLMQEIDRMLGNAGPGRGEGTR